MRANWTAEPPAEQYHVPQSPFGTTVKRSDDASLQYARPSYIDPAQNLAAQAAQTRAMQFQLLASQLGQLSGSWLRPNRNIEGKCRLGPESEPVFSCAPSEMRDLVEAGERQLASTLQAIRSLGMPATGVSISYRDGRYGVSLLGD